MKMERSAGVIVYSQDNLTKQRKYLLLLYPKGHWDLPKGKLEKNESKLEAAIRELKEETNLEAEIIPGFEESLNYHFRGFKKELIHKEVTFFVAKALHKNVILSEEHFDYMWLPYEKALNQLTFENARNVLIKAENFLKSIEN